MQPNSPEGSGKTKQAQSNNPTQQQLDMAADSRAETTQIRQILENGQSTCTILFTTKPIIEDRINQTASRLVVQSTTAINQLHTKRENQRAEQTIKH